MAVLINKFYDKNLDQWIPNIYSYAQVGVPVVEAETLDQRIERVLEYQDKNHTKPGANVICVRERPEGRYAVKEQFVGQNLVTDDGEIAYAQKAAGETPTNDFWSANQRFEVRDNATPLTPAETNTWTQFTNPVAASLKTRTGGYPKTNDTGDADNTGDTVRAVSWAVNYTTGDFTATNVSGQIITAIASPTTGTPLLNHAAFTAFAKTSTDTLKIFVNHEFENQ